MILIITTGILGAILWYLYHKLTFWQRQGIPTPGLMYQWHYYRKELVLYDQELHKKLGPVYGTYEGLTPILIVAELDLIKEVLVKEFQSFPNHKPFRFGVPIIDKNMFSLDGGEDWKRIRSIVGPTFTTGKLRAMDPIVFDAIGNLKQNLAKAANNGESVNVRKLYNSLSFDVIARCAYSTRVDVLIEPDHPILTNLDNLFSGRWDMTIALYSPKLGSFLGLTESALKPFKFFEEMTKKLLDDRKDLKEPKPNDFLQIMMDANKELESNGTTAESSKKTASPDEVMAQALIFLIAGFDTTATIMACCVYHLSKHPEVQEKLTAEVSKLKEVNHDTVMELKYLEAVLKECFRLSPPVCRIQRQCVRTTQLGNARVEPGTIVSIPAYVVHRDPRNYSDPEVFDPNRFLEGGADVDHNPYAYLPFGGGPRICIAPRFATMVAKMALATVFQKFHFEPTKETKLNYAPSSFDVLAPLDIMLKVKTISKTQ